MPNWQDLEDPFEHTCPLCSQQVRLVPLSTVSSFQPVPRIQQKAWLPGTPCIVVIDNVASHTKDELVGQSDHLHLDLETGLYLYFGLPGMNNFVICIIFFVVIVQD